MSLGRVDCLIIEPLPRSSIQILLLRVHICINILLQVPISVSCHRAARYNVAAIVGATTANVRLFTCCSCGRDIHIIVCVVESTAARLRLIVGKLWRLRFIGVIVNWRLLCSSDVLGLRLLATAVVHLRLMLGYRYLKC